MGLYYVLYIGYIEHGCAEEASSAQNSFPEKMCSFPFFAVGLLFEIIQAKKLLIKAPFLASYTLCKNMCLLWTASAFLCIICPLSLNKRPIQFPWPHL